MLLTHCEVIILKDYIRRLSTVNYGTFKTFLIQIFLGLFIGLSNRKLLEIAVLLSTIFA